MYELVLYSSDECLRGERLLVHLFPTSHFVKASMTIMENISHTCLEYRLYAERWIEPNEPDSFDESTLRKTVGKLRWSASHALRRYSSGMLAIRSDVRP